jgi:hypothetical protein
MNDTPRAPTIELYVFQDRDDRFLVRITLGSQRFYTQPIVELTISELLVSCDIALRGRAELKKREETA